jgi:hypothetical protein
MLSVLTLAADSHGRSLISHKLASAMPRSVAVLAVLATLVNNTAVVSTGTNRSRTSFVLVAIARYCTAEAVQVLPSQQCPTKTALQTEITYPNFKHTNLKKCTHDLASDGNKLGPQ